MDLCCPPGGSVSLLLVLQGKVDVPPLAPSRAPPLSLPSTVVHIPEGVENTWMGDGTLESRPLGCLVWPLWAQMMEHTASPLLKLCQCVPENCSKTEFCSHANTSSLIM